MNLIDHWQKAARKWTEERIQERRQRELKQKQQQPTKDQEEWKDSDDFHDTKWRS